jgi:hypothetical protein
MLSRHPIQALTPPDLLLSNLGGITAVIARNTSLRDGFLDSTNSKR